jgi:hypothetical protein
VRRVFEIAHLSSIALLPRLQLPKGRQESSCVGVQAFTVNVRKHPRLNPETLLARNTAPMCSRFRLPVEGYPSPVIKAQRMLLSACCVPLAARKRKGPKVEETDPLAKRSLLHKNNARHQETACITDKKTLGQ